MRWKWSSCKQRWVQVGPRSMHRMHTHSRSASSQYFTHNNNNTVTCVIMETVGHKSPSRPSIRTAFKYIFKFSLSGSWKCNDDEAMSGESPPDVLLTVYFTGRAVVNLRKPSVMSLQHWAALPQSAWEILLGKHLFLRWTKKKKQPALWFSTPLVKIANTCESRLRAGNWLFSQQLFLFLWGTIMFSGSITSHFYCNFVNCNYGIYFV